MPTVQEVRVTLAKLPLPGPFRIATTESTEALTIYARVELSDGTIGWGEGAPAPHATGETPEAGFEAAKAVSRSLIGLDAERLSRALRMLDKLLWRLPAARAALANALLDAYARLHGMPLCSLLGGCNGLQLETLVTVGLDTPEAMAERALALYTRGYRMLKLKLGGPVELDIERVKAVREAVGDAVVLTVDANTAWSYSEALRFTQEAVNLGVALVEQPLPPHDLEALARLSQLSPLPIAVDESVLAPVDVARLYSLGFRGVVNIKVSRLGGVDKAATAAKMAAEVGMKLMVGCMLESGLGIMASLHLADSIEPAFVDLDALLLLARDPSGCNPYEKPPRLREARGPGVGCEPRLPV